MRTNIVSLASILFVFGLACGDSGSGGSDTGGSDTGGSGTGAAGASGGAGGGTGAAGGSGGSGGSGGVGAAGGSGGAGAAGGSGGAGGGASVNGCTRADATEVNGNASLEWTLPFAECTAIAVGSSVTWTGNFTVHPLAGGVTPTEDAGSDISGSDQTGGSTTVTFDTAGEYPYFCTIHGASMQGVIYVE